MDCTLARSLFWLCAVVSYELDGHVVLE